MCGIVGYIGKDKALPNLITGLKSLEYRGYDSSGVSLITNKKIETIKRVGQIRELEKSLKDTDSFDSTVGIGHTRWATHGVPSVRNSHPHKDCSDRFFVVHNGIIENYKEIKNELIEKNHIFNSDTDTEVIPHLLEELSKEEKDFSQVLIKVIKKLKGTYALGILDSQNPDSIYCAKFSSPLVIGVGENENFLASDPSALIGKTKKVIYLLDGEIAEITANKINIFDLENNKVKHKIVTLNWDIEQAQKGDFSHFMIKEIHEGPNTVRSALRERINENKVTLPELDNIKSKLEASKRILILACGTSYYAGCVGEYLFEEISNLPTEVQLASEFRYRNEPLEEGTIAIAISQSGETADTLAAIRKAKENGLVTVGIVNVLGSTIARETDAVIYNNAGPEIGVASTKAFISQITVLTLLSIYLSKNNNQEIIIELERIPEKIEIILNNKKSIEEVANSYKDYENFLYIGRKFNYPTAMEGALKLKEISYIHAEGYSAGEMKHGPIAMISENFPTLAIVPKNSVSDKVLSGIEEIKARRGKVVAVSNEELKEVKETSDDTINIPCTLEVLEPLLTVIPLQLFAYYIGVKRGYDVDKPRNLAKSVTVE